MKRQSLGSNSAAATAGILCTDGTNATPIVATFSANNCLKTGDRIRIQGGGGLNTGGRTAADDQQSKDRNHSESFHLIFTPWENQFQYVIPEGTSLRDDVRGAFPGKSIRGERTQATKQSRLTCKQLIA